jgi:hypothetical protein
MATGVPAPGNMITLFTVGPFTVTMQCTKQAGGTEVGVLFSSSEANSWLDGLLVAAPNTLSGSSANPLTRRSGKWPRREPDRPGNWSRGPQRCSGAAARDRRHQQPQHRLLGGLGRNPTERCSEARTHAGLQDLRWARVVSKHRPLACEGPLPAVERCRFAGRITPGPSGAPFTGAPLSAGFDDGLQKGDKHG